MNTKSNLITDSERQKEGLDLEKITQKQIAELTKVSIGTVDRALNNRGRINEETKNKILKVAEELNYQPNKIARALVLNRSIRIAAIFPEKPEYFFGKIKIGIQAAQHEFSDYSISVDNVYTESLNPVKQKEVLDSLEIEKYDGIIIAAGGESIQRYIDEIADKKIPVVTFNADVQSSKRKFFIGQDSMLAGRIAGELMGKFIGGKGRVAVLTGFSDVLSHQERCTGFSDSIKDNFSDIELVGPYEYYDSENDAYTVSKRVLEEHDHIEGIYVTSAPGAVGAGRAIKEMDIPHKISLIGFDINDIVKGLFHDGICSAIIFQDPYLQAYYAIKFLAKNILEGWVPPKKSMFIISKIILKENVNEYDFENEWAHIDHNIK